MTIRDELKNSVSTEAIAGNEQDKEEHPQPLSDPESVEKYITLKAAGNAVGIPYFKMRIGAKRRLFPTYRFGNKRILVLLSEVIAAINRSRVGGDQ